ncbi:MAG: CmpA/NrtA family ABC transporter substrate-binding protein [Akkermansiaceae bacterium]|nr:CmpA/NrtA family ABC transporter substrate-binding protein [Akkermansiaceae bacterium]
MNFGDLQKTYHSPLHLGFLPVSDCTPIAVAVEMGIFERYGLNVLLSRESNGSVIRNKIYHGELDAAQSIAGVAFSLAMGFSEQRCEIAVPLVFNLHGSAITLSAALDPLKIGNGKGLADWMENRWSKPRPLTLAIPHRDSSQHILLHRWLTLHGMSSNPQVEVVAVQPEQMPAQLASGLIDGFCVEEPWNSEAILAGTGWCPAVSSALALWHHEKMLLVTGEFIRERREEVVTLIAALLEACELCADPSFREEMVSILSLKQYIGVSEKVLRHSFNGGFMTGGGAKSVSDFHLFYGDKVNRPTVDKAAWALAGLRDIGVLQNFTYGSLSRIYREDLFHSVVHAYH